MSVEKQKTMHAGASVRVGASPAKSIHTPSSNDSFRKSGFKSKSVIRSMRSRLVPTTVLDKPSPSEIRVYNDAGEDVTPKPLLQVDRHSAKGQHTVAPAESSGGTPTDASQSSFYQAGTVAAAGATTGGPFTRSVFSGSVSGRSTDIFSDDLSDSQLDGSSMWIDMKVEYKRDEASEDLMEGDLDVPIEITLAETDMIWMLEIPAISVMSNSDEGKVVSESNLHYQELVKGKAGNSDRYTDRGMNTFNDPPKNKSTLTVAINRRECGVQATESDIFDTSNGLQKGADQKIANADDDLILFSSEGPATEAAANLKPDQGKDSDDVEARPADVSPAARIPGEGGREMTAMSSMAIGESVFGVKDSSEPTKQDAIDTSLDEERILKSDSMKRHLVVMERIINLNTYQPKLAAYRNFPNLSVDTTELQPPVEADKTKVATKSSQKIEAMSDLGPSLDRLWSYQCSLTKGRNVSCIAWNRVNPDLVAVGYGQFEYSKQKSGLVCCWSIKNPEYPERVYETQAGVLSVDFSQSHPSLLAVGMYTGTIAIYNVALPNKEPILDSMEASGKHIGPVWQLCWIEKERGKGEERTEVLVSISADGRVTQWAIRKGFESYDLIKLKRLTVKQTAQGKQKKSEAYISKYASGLCFNFSSKDSNIYLAGTEDGYIHKCSCSYNEQYLDSYQGHTGPVYGVSVSPYDDNIFLSCSADWSIRLWHQERLQPVLNLFSSTKAVHSVSWSPKSSTVFACVNEGALEVWDLSENTLDPILQNTPSAVDIKLSSVSFSRNSDCLLVGDSEGQVTVFQLRGMPVIHADQMEALHHVINSSLASQLNS